MGWCIESVRDALLSSPSSTEDGAQPIDFRAERGYAVGIRRVLILLDWQTARRTLRLRVHPASTCAGGAASVAVNDPSVGFGHI